MRDHFDFLQRINELLGVIALVGAQGDGCFWVARRLYGSLDHHLGRFALSVTIGGGDHGVGNEAVTVVAQGVAHVAQAAGVIAFAIQPRISVSAGVVGGVAAFFAMEVSGVSLATFTPTATTCITAVVGYKTLVASPGLDQRAIDTEVLAREQVLRLGLLQC